MVEGARMRRVAAIQLTGQLDAVGRSRHGRSIDVRIRRISTEGVVIRWERSATSRTTYWEMTIWEVLLMLKLKFRQKGKETGKAQVTVTLTAFPGMLQVPEAHVDHVVV